MNPNARTTSSLCILIALAGCHSSVEDDFVSLPAIGDDTKSLILATTEPSPRGLRMVAVEREDPLRIPVQFGARFELLTFDRSLEELELESGPVLQVGRCSNTCARISPTAVFAAEGPIDSLEWIPTTMSPAIRDRLVANADAICGVCRSHEQLTLDVPGRGAAFIDTWGRRVIGATPAGRIFTISEDGTTHESCDAPMGVETGAVHERTMTLVLALTDGSIVESSSAIDSSSCVFRTLGHVEGRPFRLDVSEDDAPTVAYVLTSTGAQVALWRVDSVSSVKRYDHTLDDVLVPIRRRGIWGGVSWFAPEQVVFVVGDDNIFRLNGQEVSTEQLGVESARLQSVLVTPLRTLVGTEPWGVASYDDNWSVLSEAPSWNSIGAMVIRGDALLVAQRGPLVFFDLAQNHYCEAFDVLPASFVRSAARLGQHDYLLADDQTASEPTVRWVRPSSTCE